MKTLTLANHHLDNINPDTLTQKCTICGTIIDYSKITYFYPEGTTAEKGIPDGEVFLFDNIAFKTIPNEAYKSINVNYCQPKEEEKPIKTLTMAERIKTGNTPVLLTLPNHSEPTFVLTPIKISETAFEFQVDEIDSFDADNLPIETTLYLKALIKWDACSHFYFGDQGYIHICGKHDFENHIQLMKMLYEIASQVITSFDKDL